MLREKIVYSVLILITSTLELILFDPENYTWYVILLNMISLGFAVKLGLLGKHLLDVILPGTYVRRKKKPKVAFSKEEIEAKKAAAAAARAKKATATATKE